jgi:hypothetical protein
MEKQRAADGTAAGGYFRTAVSAAEVASRASSSAVT